MGGGGNILGLKLSDGCNVQGGRPQLQMYPRHPKAIKGG